MCKLVFTHANRDEVISGPGLQANAPIISAWLEARVFILAQKITKHLLWNSTASGWASQSALATA